MFLIFPFLLVSSCVLTSLLSIASTFFRVIEKRQRGETYKKRDPSHASTAPVKSSLLQLLQVVQRDAATFKATQRDVRPIYAVFLCWRICVVELCAAGDVSVDCGERRPMRLRWACYVMAKDLVICDCVRWFVFTWKFFVL